MISKNMLYGRSPHYFPDQHGMAIQPMTHPCVVPCAIDLRQKIRRMNDQLLDSLVSLRLQVKSAIPIHVTEKRTVSIIVALPGFLGQSNSIGITA